MTANRGVGALTEFYRRKRLDPRPFYKTLRVDQASRE